jgi:hypothetical protein
MQIKDSRYLKVWKIHNTDYGVKLDLGESKKKYNADGYDKWTWFQCKVKGNACNVQVNEGDLITIISGIITQNKSDDGRWFNDVVIFEMEVTPGNKPQTIGDYQRNNNQSTNNNSSNPSPGYSQQQNQGENSYQSKPSQQSNQGFNDDDIIF